MPKATQNRVSSSKFQAIESSLGSADNELRGISAWLAVVRTYQKCSEVLSIGIKPLGIKLAQHEVMMHLLRSGQQTQQQLATNSYVTKSHMSAVLTEMDAVGWIVRADSDTDKRSKEISLTPTGLALAQRAYGVQTQVVNAMMSPLSDKQISELEKVSRNAVVSLDALEESLGALA
jgi:DNA-binding MarR family transcriptional regulator